jgi:hypothetical protein
MGDEGSVGGMGRVKVKKITESQEIEQLREALLENANYRRVWSETPSSEKIIERAILCIRMGLDFGEVSDKLDKMKPAELTETLNKINGINMKATKEKERLRAKLFPQEIARWKKLLNEQKR